MVEVGVVTNWIASAASKESEAPRASWSANLFLEKDGLAVRQWWGWAAPSVAAEAS